MQSFRDLGLALLSVSRVLLILLTDKEGARIKRGKLSWIRPERDAGLLAHIPLVRTQSPTIAINCKEAGNVVQLVCLRRGKEHRW